MITICATKIEYSFCAYRRWAMRTKRKDRQLSRCGRAGRDLDPDCCKPQKGWAHDHTG